MFLKKVKHKDFGYLPRFFDPNKETKEKKISFRIKGSYQETIKKKRSALVWLILIIIVLYFYLSLS